MIENKLEDLREWFNYELDEIVEKDISPRKRDYLSNLVVDKFVEKYDRKDLYRLSKNELFEEFDNWINNHISDVVESSNILSENKSTDSLKSLFKEDTSDFSVELAIRDENNQYSNIGWVDKDTDINYNEGIYGFSDDVRNNVKPLTRNEANKLAQDIISNAPAGDVLAGVVPYSSLPISGTPNEDEDINEDEDEDEEDSDETTDEDINEEDTEGVEDSVDEEESSTEETE